MSPTVTMKSDSGAHQRRLGKYALLEPLPVYGMVQPYVARADGEIDLVIVKRLLIELATDPVAQGRFEREARIARHLRHENLVRALDAGTDEDVCYLVTDWVRGVSLYAVLDRLRGMKRRIPEKVFGVVALNVLAGLGYAHRATDSQGMPLGIVHRDLAPRSIILSFGGDVKVADFGVARAQMDDFKTRPGIAVGSVPYMSPEQAHGQPLDPRSDIYALGALFYELLTNRPVVVQGSMLGMLQAVVSEEPRPLASLRPDLPPPLVQAVQRALAKDPEERWPDAESFATALTATVTPARDSQGLLSQFVRHLLPEREAEMAGLMELIRDNAAQSRRRPSSSVTAEGQVMPSDLDGHSQKDRATEVLPRRRSVADEPPEPSVMTMPGALASAGAVAVSVRSSSPRTGPIVAILGAVALGLGVCAWWVTQGSDPTSAVVPAASQSAGIGPKVVTVSPPSAEAAPRPRVEAQPRQAPRPRAKTKPRSKAKVPAPDLEVASTISEVPADPRVAQLAALKQRVRTLKANPRNPVKFQSLHRELTKLAGDLPPHAARKVRAKLGAAERTYDARLLGEALDKIIRVDRLRRR